MAKAIHAMIRVRDEARSVEFYREAFGLDVADRYPFDGFTLVYLRNPEADFELELTINDGKTEPYELGNGYGHMAFVVEVLEAAHARIAAMGAGPRDIKQFDREGKKFARFFFVADPDGYQIEVLEHFGRFA